MMPVIKADGSLKQKQGGTDCQEQKPERKAKHQRFDSCD